MPSTDAEGGADTPSAPAEPSRPRRRSRRAEVPPTHLPGAPVRGVIAAWEMDPASVVAAREEAGRRADAAGAETPGAATSPAAASLTGTPGTATPGATTPGAATPHAAARRGATPRRSEEEDPLLGGGESAAQRSFEDGSSDLGEWMLQQRPPHWG